MKLIIHLVFAVLLTTSCASHSNHHDCQSCDKDKQCKDGKCDTKKKKCCDDKKKECKDGKCDMKKEKCCKKDKK